MWWMLMACTQKPVPQTEAPGAHKQEAPVDVAWMRTPEGSTVTAVFERAGQAELHVYGTRGLEAPGERVRFKGPVTSGQQVVVSVKHTGAGSLAVRAVSEFDGERMDSVRSFVVGEPEATPVPRTDDAKGWEATRR